MPTYNFSCKCSTNFELRLSFDEFDKLGKKKQPQCPVCHKKKTVTQIFDTAPHCSVKTITTIGQLAEQQTKKLGTTKLQEEFAKKEEKQPKRKDNWYGSLGKEKAKKLFSGTKEEQKRKINKYVREGN